MTKLRGITIAKILSIQEDQIKIIIEGPILKRDYETVEALLDQHRTFVIIGKTDRATLDRINSQPLVWVEFDDGTGARAFMEISTMRDLVDPDFSAKGLLQFEANLLVTERDVFNHLKFNPVVFV